MRRDCSLSSKDLHDLLDRIKTGKNTSNDLDGAISYFYTASNVTPLGELLEADDQNVLRSAVYILAEIGKSGFPLRDKARALLTHSDVQIRYWAMNSVVSCFEREAAKRLITTAGLLSDIDEFIRTRAYEMIKQAKG